MKLNSLSRNQMSFNQYENWIPPYSSEVGYLCNLDVDFICEAILPYLERLTDFVQLSHTSKLFRSVIFSGKTHTIWSSRPVDICVDSLCRFGCGRVPVTPNLAWSILRYTSVVCVRLHLPFNGLSALLESILGNQLEVLRRLHLRFRNSDEPSSSLVQQRALVTPIRPINLTHLTIYGYPDTISSRNYLDHLLSMFGNNLESLQFMESSPAGVLKLLQSNVCPILSNLCIEGEQLFDDLWGFQSDSLKFLSLHDTGMKLCNNNSIHDTLQFPFLTRLEITDKGDNTSALWRTADDIRRGISTLPPSLKGVELRIDSRLANIAIVELSRRLCNLESLSLQLPDKDLDGPSNIRFSTIIALKNGCPLLFSLEITDGLIGFDVDAFLALKDFTCLRKIKLLYDDYIVEALPRLLEESYSYSIEDVQFYENAGEIFNEEGGAARWHAMEESLVKISGVFPCVNIGLSDCW